MSTPMSLHDYGVDEYPVIAKRLLLGEIKLTALIAASDSMLYFLPENEFGSVTQAIGVFTTFFGIPNKIKAYQAKSGKYEILSIERISKMLDKIYLSEKDPNLRRADGCENTIQIGTTLSPKGEKGYLVDVVYIEKNWQVAGSPNILVNRILLEEIKTPVPKGKYQVDTPEFAAVIEVWEKYWKDGSGMTQDAIVAELMGKGFKRVRAEAIEMICRPIDRRGGGHKKKK